MAGRKWLVEHDEFIKSNYGKVSSEDMAKTLKRTRKAIWHRFEVLKLVKECPLIGDKQNRLTVISAPYYKDSTTQKISYIKCLCDCGNEMEIRLTYWRKNRTKSCGCLTSETSYKSCIERNTTHGASYTRLFRIWCGMRARCSYKTSLSYKNYGGKGISVCDEWAKDFVNFQSWAIENGYDDSLSIDRKDNNLGYCPENCKWSDSLTQANNKTSNTKVTAFNETKTLAEWTRDERCQTSAGSIKYRIEHGWSPELAIITSQLTKDKYLGQKAAEIRLQEGLID